MRTRRFAAVTAAVLALAGCQAPQEAASALPPVQVVRPPAASAGGACILWTYDMIERRLGIRFDVAAAGAADETSTCVVQPQDGSLPDLTLSVVERTRAGAALYARAYVPAHAKRIKGLGIAAYRLVAKPSDGHGPVVEVGWLSPDRQVCTLRLTLAPDTPPAEASTLVEPMMALAADLLRA